MVLARAWGRQLSVGVSAALLVPGALLGALVVLALAGGFARLGSLGQAFTGPPAPATVSGAVAAHAGRASPGTALAALATAFAGGAGGAAAAPPATASGKATHGSVPGAVVHAHAQVPGAGSTAPATPRAPAAGQPAPRPHPQPTLIDGIVSAGSSVTRQLPAPAGPAATAALQSAGSTLDGVLPPQAP